MRFSVLRCYWLKKREKVRGSVQIHSLTRKKRYNAGPSSAYLVNIQVTGLWNCGFRNLIKGHTPYRVLEEVSNEGMRTDLSENCQLSLWHWWHSLCQILRISMKENMEGLFLKNRFTCKWETPASSSPSGALHGKPTSKLIFLFVLLFCKDTLCVQRVSASCCARTLVRSTRAPKSP